MVILLLVACAAPEPEPEPLPVPPVPPARVPPIPRAAAGTPPAGAEAPQPNGEEPGAAVAQAPLPIWRVSRDGTLGCAEPAPLRLVRGGEDATPRLLAQARVAGGCRTTFRRNEWALETAEDDLVRLRLLNGPDLTLWFLRADLVAP